jgi:mannose-6-phosphate isomerase-like protein (cupin superfamily)
MPAAFAVPPGTRHKLQNTGSEPLVLLCCSSPPYYDERTPSSPSSRGA